MAPERIPKATFSRISTPHFQRARLQRIAPLQLVIHFAGALKTSGRAYGGTRAVKRNEQLAELKLMQLPLRRVDAQDPGHPMAMSQRPADFKACGQKPPLVPQVQLSIERLGSVSPVARSVADHAVRFRSIGVGRQVAAQTLREWHLTSDMHEILLSFVCGGLYLHLNLRRVESRSIIRRAQSWRRSVRDASRSA
jgi:hypothetical protein